MASQLLSASTAATVLAISISVFILHRLRSWIPRDRQVAGSSLKSDLPQSSTLGKVLANTLPDCVIFAHNVSAFNRSAASYWAQQECEVVPECVVRPRNVDELCKAVAILKREYDEQKKQNGNVAAQGLFAVRSGGHSPIPGAASIKDGVVIDLGLFCEVNPSEDGSTVTIGAGVRWMDVSRVLDKKGLAVVGGRNSAVGVGGFTLGGGLSFFSPRFGFACSNILSYQVILASGYMTTASSSTNSELWRALKGGSNNFGIVTSFTARSIPCTNIWSGFLYMPAFQQDKVLAAFHASVNRLGDAYDNDAAGPIACFSYVQPLGMQVLSVNIVHTNPPQHSSKWPVYWQNSSFASLWRLWSTCKVRTLTSATDEMSALNPPGKRQVFATTTIKNDLGTLAAAHAAYLDAINSIRRARAKGVIWTLVFQPLLPDWMRRGDANPLGLHDYNEALVIINFTVNWVDGCDDEFIKTTTRKAIEQIDAMSAANQTGHPYRYLNYCAEWQKPFEGYGDENRLFLQGVSKSYDPDGLFQKGCVGGFKLDMVDDAD